ncbi:MAG: FIST C-terminal domain-containing protein [Alphaproteobacteria bacterium]|nr:FIST C-terminal domain-containing protein [Alphaproteobacteria bacterium]
MKLKQYLWTADKGLAEADQAAVLDDPQLVLYFAAPKVMDDGKRFAELKQRFPGSHLVGCSTGGEILGEEVLDGTIAITAVRFERGSINVCGHALTEGESSLLAGKSLAEKLKQDGLKAVFVLSDGTKVNGSDLVEGIRSAVGDEVIITGGLAGDGADFKRTVVGCDCQPKEGMLAIIGFYGDALHIRHGSFGGWDRFGPERIITKSEANVLYELDNEPALDLYKRYLGDEATRLPASALLFPLSVRADASDKGDVVRTVVGIDEDKKSMIFAGDVQQGYSAQLMRGNFDHLVEGAQKAAEQAGGGNGPSLAILVSCIGRKLLLDQRIVEEVEAVAPVLGKEARLTGFYSYGEISPHGFTGKCELHNQTMTITLISEN